MERQYCFDSLEDEIPTKQLDRVLLPTKAHVSMCGVSCCMCHSLHDSFPLSRGKAIETPERPKGAIIAKVEAVKATRCGALDAL